MFHHRSKKLSHIHDITVLQPVVLNNSHGGTDSVHLCGNAVAASESNLHNKRLKLDYEEITPCLKEVTLVWEKLLGTPERPKVKVDMEIIQAAVAQGKVYRNQYILSESFILDNCLNENEQS